MSDKLKDDLPSENEGLKLEFDALKGYRTRSWYQNFTANWVNSVLDFCNINKMTLDHVGKMPETESSKYHANRLKEVWEKSEKKKWSLVKCILKAYWFPMVLNFLSQTYGNFASLGKIYILAHVLSYIGGDHDNFNSAVLCIMILPLMDMISQGITTIITNVNSKTLTKIGGAVEGLVYNKIFKISHASNSIRKGELQNMLKWECRNIYHNIQMIPSNLNFPISMITCLISLYAYLGHILWIAIGLIVLSYYAQKGIQKFQNKLYTLQRHDQDNNVGSLNEIVENIKVIKMNGWASCIEEKINNSKNREYTSNFTSNLFFMPTQIFHTFNNYSLTLGVFLISVLYFDITFSVPDTVIVWKLLGNLKGYTQQMRYLSSTRLQFTRTFERIEKVLLADEITEGAVQKVQEDREESIIIEKSSYFWGFNLVDANMQEYMKQQLEKTRKEKEEKKKKGEEDEDEKYKEKKYFKDKIVLRDIELKIKNEFVAVIGEVGSGKTSLISTILGDTVFLDDEIIEKYENIEVNQDDSGLEGSSEEKIITSIIKSNKQKDWKNSAKISVAGSVTLVEQKPFILSKSIRENILFGEEMDEERYNRIVEACQLGRDLEILEGGDLTEIGEKGINLSGGQKARLSLARALYSDKDIILMDDPFSAFDAHVKKAIFDEVCCGELKNKTRVLVTHAVDFLDRVDRIIVMDKGRIRLNGTYDELMEDEHFQKIMKTVNKERKSSRDDTSSTTEESQEKKEKVEKEETKDKDYLSKKGKKLLTREDEEVFETTFQTYIDYFKYCRYGLIFVCIGLIFTSVSTFIQIKRDYPLLNWVKTFSSVAEEDRDYSGLKTILYISLTQIIIGFASNTINLFQRYFIEKKMFLDLIRRVMRAPVNLYFDITPSGIIQNRITNDVYSLSNFCNSLSGTFYNITSVGTTVGYLIYNAPGSLYAIPPLIALYWLIISRYSKPNRDVGSLSRCIEAPSTTHLSESIDGATTIRSYGKIHEFEDKYYEFADQRSAIALLNEGFQKWINVRNQFITSVFTGFIHLYCVYNRSIIDSIMIGILMDRVSGLYWSIYGVMYDVNNYGTSIESFSKCKKMLEIPQEAEARLDIPKDEHGEPWMSKGHINFKDLSIRYRPDTEIVLDKVNMDIQPGEKVGIVGRTGAGKSTLCLALCRILECLEGSIEIDGIDISKVGIDDLRDRVTIIPQEPVLFQNTLRFNLDPLKKCTDEQVIDILKRAGLEKLLSRDGGGLKSQISEKGSNLSAGEKALICICRAALRKNKVVLMDEATASIDVNTEEIIQKLIKEEFADSTVITVAHRLNTVMESDKIAVMSFGKVVEFDDPKVLCENPESAFSDLLNQFNN